MTREELEQSLEFDDAEFRAGRLSCDEMRSRRFERGIQSDLLFAAENTLEYVKRMYDVG